MFLSNILSTNNWIFVYKTTPEKAVTIRNYFTQNSLAQETYTVSSSNITYILSFLVLSYFKQIIFKIFY
jgi:hypothetical protein